MKPTGTLYIVATPIGNLNDITPHALETLKSVDVIAAEDTRHAKKLLQHFGVQTPMLAYHDHNEQAATEKLISRLIAGDNIALISDAGTPLISDPGFRLTQTAHLHGIIVVPIVGACAAIAALSVAGLPSDRFSFEGFLPNKSSQRQLVLQKLSNHSQTMIFYESPHRVAGSLTDMVSVFGGDRLACLCRELTKTFETVKQAPLSELSEFVANDNNQQKGEIVLVVAGAEKKSTQDVDEATLSLLKRLLSDLSVKKTASLASDLTGIKKNTLYDAALKLKEDA